MAFDQDIYFPDAGGTVDMTSPNALLAPDNSQNLLAPDLSGARQAVAQGPTAMPVKTGWGGFTQNGIQHSNSTKRKIGAALLSLLSPEAGAAVTDQPFNAAMGQAQETERERIANQTLSQHALDVAKEKAGIESTLSTAAENRSHAAYFNAQVNQTKMTPPDAQSLKILASHINPGDDEHSYDWIGGITNPSVLAGLQTSILKQMETPAEKNKTMDISWAVEPYAKLYGIDSPDGIASLKKGFAAAPVEFAKSVATALENAKKPVPEAAVDKQKLDYFLAHPPTGYSPNPLEFDRYQHDQKIKEAQASVAPLTDAALDQNAERYWQTGQMAPVGFGDKQTRQKIMNRAAELHPEGSLGANSAEYAANKATLGQITKQQAAVEAFSNTAGKNLDIFLNSAKKVIDSGSPWINQPLRAVSQQGFGSDDLAAFNTARQVAVAEIAKVVNNPSLAGQLSDTARNEMQAILSPNATLSQIYASAKILKSDMQNRSSGLSDTRRNIMNRLGGKTDATPERPANVPANYVWDQNRNNGAGSWRKP